MEPTLIGITGGSGAGKSTLCTSLQNTYSEKIGLVQLDDYFRPSSEVPQLEGMENWDHPDALYLDKLASDLRDLSNGKSVSINTKNETLNPNFKEAGKRIPVKFDPKPVILVEGFLVLYDKRVRDLLTTSIWLDIDHDIRYSRRVHFKNDEYEKKVMIPMQEEFAFPTKKYAKHVLDVTNLDKNDVFENVVHILQNQIDLN